MPDDSTGKGVGGPKGPEPFPDDFDPCKFGADSQQPWGAVDPSTSNGNGVGGPQGPPPPDPDNAENDDEWFPWQPGPDGTTLEPPQEAKPLDCDSACVDSDAQPDVVVSGGTGACLTHMGTYEWDQFSETASTCTWSWAGGPTITYTKSTGALTIAFTSWAGVDIAGQVSCVSGIVTGTVQVNSLGGPCGTQLLTFEFGN